MKNKTKRLRKQSKDIKEIRWNLMSLTRKKESILNVKK